MVGVLWVAVGSSTATAAIVVLVVEASELVGNTRFWGEKMLAVGL